MHPDTVFGLVVFAHGALILGAGLAIGSGLFGGMLSGLGGIFIVVGLLGMAGESPER